MAKSKVQEVEQEESNPSFKARRYACMRWPFLRIGSLVHFENGFYTAQSEDEANLIEGNDAFGKHIHPIKWEPKAVPTKSGPVAELIESEIVAALAEQQPRARRGSIGTRQE